MRGLDWWLDPEIFDPKFRKWGFWTPPGTQLETRNFEFFTRRLAQKPELQSGQEKPSLFPNPRFWDHEDIFEVIYFFHLKFEITFKNRKFEYQYQETVTFGLNFIYD